MQSNHKASFSLVPLGLGINPLEGLKNSREAVGFSFVRFQKVYKRRQFTGEPLFPSIKYLVQP